MNAGVGVGMECGVVRHACSPEGTENLRAFCDVVGQRK
jgi:hypothetical protein